MIEQLIRRASANIASWSSVWKASLTSASIASGSSARTDSRSSASIASGSSAIEQLV